MKSLREQNSPPMKAVISFKDKIIHEIRPELPCTDSILSDHGSYGFAFTVSPWSRSLVNER